LATKPLSIGIVGAGRMGLAIINEIATTDALKVGAVWVRDASSVDDIATPSGAVVSSDLDHVVAAADVVVDFSLPQATVDVANASGSHGKPWVCGVSGLGTAQLAALDRAAKTVAVVYDRNMSQGITVLQDLVERAAVALGSDFSVSIHETHHVHKKDAPSGTALKLGETVARVRGDAEDIRYESERRGEVPGDHEVVFASPTETVVLRHSVATRHVFAVGALRAARWVTNREPGLYSMQDVLFGGA
jgi:4-hydroxy-tetrahydrodipicolinate reductase